MYSKNTFLKNFGINKHINNLQKKFISKLNVANIKPNQVHNILRKTMLVDGYDLVFDPKKSHGSYLHDSVTQKDYLDMFSFFASWSLSYDHPKLNNNEFKHLMGELSIHNPANSDIYTKEFAQFVATFERVCMPQGFNHLFLISTGTLAVENALKIAFDWKAKKNLKAGKKIKNNKVIHFREAFHARSGYALSLTNTDPAKYLHFPLFDWPRIINPKITFPLEDLNLENCINNEEASLNHIEALLIDDGDDISSIILEPIQGEGGDNHFRPEFWQSLRKLADQYDVMLIADEVQSGMGMTGKMWAYQHLGAQPDIICFGKKAQVCGVMCNSRVDEVEDNVFNVSSRINSTWGGSLTDMMRSVKIIETIEEENLVENARILGTYTLGKLHKLSNKYPTTILNVRGKGLMCAFDLPNKELCAKLLKVAYENQLIIISCGNQSIRLRPLLDVKYEDIDNLYNILDKCINKLQNE